MKMNSLPSFFRVSSSVCLLATTSIVAFGSAAHGANICYAPDGETEIACFVSSSDVSVGTPVGANTELATTSAGAGFDDAGFSLSIEEQTFAGAPKPEVPSRSSDVALADNNIQIRFDGLDVLPRLNVTTLGARTSYSAGEQVTFRTSTNYPAWIERSEVIVRATSGRNEEIVASLPTHPNGTVNWVMPADGNGQFVYTVRVYNADGRFNETEMVALERAAEAGSNITQYSRTAGETEDRTSISNFTVYGGAVTTSADQISPGTSIRVMGEAVPVDQSGSFVVQRILPPGQHVVGVDVRRNGQRLNYINREVTIPESEFFYVGLLDLTASYQMSGPELSRSTEGLEFDGRAAFYLKGRVAGNTIITASADTGHGDIENIFGRLAEKDPQSLLRRLRPADHYLTYGDSSSAYDDTPSSGRMYLRVERDDDYALWGDFKSDLENGTYLRYNRSLYGAKLNYRSDAVTELGDERVAVNAFAAKSDSRVRRDVLRGTGGSAYFLSRQDLNAASETIQIEVRDPDTDRVVNSRVLVAGRDYSIDYIQGVVLLSEPLSGSAPNNTVAGNGVSDNVVSLVVEYEHTPAIGDSDGYTYGGQLAGWVTDRIRLSVATLQDVSDDMQLQKTSFDVHYRYGSDSYVEFEAAQSKSHGFESSVSTDGGLTFDLIGGTDEASGRAYRFEAEAGFADLGLSMPGHVGLYYENKKAGFATVNRGLRDDERLIGVYGAADISQQMSLAFSYENLAKSNDALSVDASVEIEYEINDQWSLQAGLSNSNNSNDVAPTQTGARTELGLRLDYTHNEDLAAYAFGRTTVARNGGRRAYNRYGIGVDGHVTDRLSANLEVSSGTDGLGGLLHLAYKTRVNSEVYFGYSLDPSRTRVGGSSLSGRDNGAFVLGMKGALGDKVSSFVEHKYDLFGDHRSITRAYGVTYTPNDAWRFGGDLEMGQVTDPNAENFSRLAFSTNAAYRDAKNFAFDLRFEYRDEQSDDTSRDRKTYLLSGSAEYKTSRDWRALAGFDAVYSQSDEGSVRNGEYMEASLGYAYRPAENNGVNALLKYTYLRDLPGEDQENASGNIGGASQRSHILSANVTYDWTEKLTVGAKLGYRVRSSAPRDSDAFQDSTAQLFVLRTDWHVVHKWDIMGEARAMYMPETNGSEYGALLGVYRHVGGHTKVGVGYEWGQVSDDLTDIEYSNSGLFLNVVSKF